MSKKFYVLGFVFLFLAALISCNKTNPLDRLQGVYQVDRAALKQTLTKAVDTSSELATKVLEAIADNAIMELKVQGDSVDGIISFMGQNVVIKSKVYKRNDSLYIKVGDNEVYLIPKGKGLLYLPKGSDTPIKFDKVDRKDLSSEAKSAIEEQLKQEQAQRAFEQRLGKWQVGYFVDEFGDKTGKKFVYCLVRGKGENSLSSDNVVYVRAIADNGKLSFDIFDEDLKTHETFPEGEYGLMKMKFPDGSVKTERVYFYEKSFVEAGKEPILYNYLLNDTGKVKVYVDLSTANEFLSDKYWFTLSQSNLKQALDSLKSADK